MTSGFGALLFGTVAVGLFLVSNFLIAGFILYVLLDKLGDGRW